MKGILDFLTLLDRVDNLAAARADTLSDNLPEQSIHAIDAIVKVADSARLHRLGYEVAVVLGYASFERFIRDLIEFIAKTMSEFCTKYEDLPKSMRDHHLRLTLKVAGLQSDRSTLDEPAVSVMLSKLLRCIDGTTPYALNDSVFADHQANLRMPVLREALRRVGVDVDEEPTSSRLIAILEGELSGLYASSSSVVNNLADRRNQAAHGGETELLDRPTLRAILRFIRALADHLAENVANHLSEILITRYGKEIGRIEHTWTNADSGERTICRVRPAVEVYSGQEIIVKGAGFQLATIRSIQINHVDVKVAGPSTEPHGFDIGLPARKGQRLFAAPGNKIEMIEGLWAVE